ncbi:DUF3710 domain-containing protein [Pseudonocardia nigra]|uniref:DUF3710 domain-containing protein n=1 Tax=Pseudonocardia nigra TaxID=1921578 RepID=UPI001C5E7F32|nr:DUF3710 domain-containing protein [Pseudonocardia nigra]
MARRNRSTADPEEDAAADLPRGDTALALDRPDDPPGTGPYDVDDIDPEVTDALGTVDFGAVRVPVSPRGTVSVEPTAKGRMQAVHITLPEGRLSVSALAAPKSSRLWPELAKEIETSLRDGGARVRSFTGDWGRELHATSGAATSVFVGVDGPRWMLYGVATGPTAQSAPLEAELRRMLRGIVVVRGRSPYPVRTVLPLVVPEELAAEATPDPEAAPVVVRTAAVPAASDGSVAAPVPAAEQVAARPASPPTDAMPTARPAAPPAAADLPVTEALPQMRPGMRPAAAAADRVEGPAEPAPVAPPTEALPRVARTPEPGTDDRVDEPAGVDAPAVTEALPTVHRATTTGSWARFTAAPPARRERPATPPPWAAIRPAEPAPDAVDRPAWQPEPPTEAWASVSAPPVEPAAQPDAAATDPLDVDRLPTEPLSVQRALLDDDRPGRHGAAEPALPEPALPEPEPTPSWRLGSRSSLWADAEVSTRPWSLEELAGDGASRTPAPRNEPAADAGGSTGGRRRAPEPGDRTEGSVRRVLAAEYLLDVSAATRGQPAPRNGRRRRAVERDAWTEPLAAPVTVGPVTPDPSPDAPRRRGRHAAPEPGEDVAPETVPIRVQLPPEADLGPSGRHRRTE